MINSSEIRCSDPDLLLMQMPEDTPLRKPMVKIKETGMKAAAIVQDLLTLSRRGVVVNNLVILDMIMERGMNGLETYKKILELHPYQKAIVTSGYSKNEDVKEVMRLGAGQYIKKPYLFEEMALAVKKELSNDKLAEGTTVNGAYIP